MYLGEALFYLESHPRIPHPPQIVLCTHRMAPLRNSCLTTPLSGAADEARRSTRNTTRVRLNGGLDLGYCNDF